MIQLTNRFGTGEMLEESDLTGKRGYFVSTACMSVTSDAASFIQSQLNMNGNENSKTNRKASCAHVDKKAHLGLALKNATDYVIVLGCQVTDLAVLNDIRMAEKCHEMFPDAQIIMGGCLAYRFDIELPKWCKRIGALRSEYTPITKQSLDSVNWQPAFWTNENGEDVYKRKTSSLFRNHYPLKIGAGCHGKCKYCTIRDTRGEGYETDAYLQVEEFLKASENSDFEGVVLVSDSSSAKQIKDWCHIAKRYNRPISFRNVEPQTALSCTGELLNLALAGLLRIFHCPIQSNDDKVLKAMNRNVEMTKEYIKFAQMLRKLGVYVATNIIRDYVVDDELIENMPTEWLDEYFDYWVWNPYFDGNWDRKKAESRFEKYILN